MLALLRNIAIIIFIFSCIIYIFQDKLIFFPIKQSEDWKFPSIPDYQIDEFFFNSHDGTKLCGITIRAISQQSIGDQRPVTPFVLFSHGNGGNIYYNLERAYSLVQNLKIDIFLYDYRGYGKSSGTPTVAGTIMDGKAALNYALTTLKVKPDNLILYGVSLGTGVTAELLQALNMKCGGVVLESGFRSLRHMAGHRFPIIGPLVLRENYPTDEIIQKFDGNLLVIHSKADEIIPFDHSQVLFDICPSTKKRSHWMSGFGHNDPVWNDQNYLAAWKDFIAEAIYKQK